MGCAARVAFVAESAAGTSGLDVASPTATISQERSRLYLVPRHLPCSISEPRTEVWALCATLIALQLLDFALTATGVSNFGLHAEGNPLVRSLMASLGAFPALLLVKVTAIGVVCGLYSLSKQVAWIPAALKVVIALYLFAAIIPWAGILLMHIS